MALYPTKTRLALLEAVDAGHVFDWLDDDERLATWDTTGAEHGEPARKVTARIDEMVKAGWVAIGADDFTWTLTDAGRAVLAEMAA